MGKRRVPTVTVSGPDVRGHLRFSRAEREIDLHGKLVREAVHLARSFLHRTHATTPGIVVRLITGRGMHSPTGPRVRPAIDSLLSSAKEVAEYAQAVDGGSFLVRLKK